MSRRGTLLALLRVVVLMLLLIGLAALPNWIWASPFLIAAIAIYWRAPRPALPDRALSYNWVTAIAGPDWIGFLFGGLLCVLPIWAARADGGAELLHPVAFLVWPIAAILLSLPVIGWRNEAYALVLDAHSFTIHTGFKPRSIQFDAVTQAKPWRRGLPRWMRYLTPFLIAKGYYGQAGGILLARDSTGIALELTTGPKVVIKADGFETPTRALMKRLQQAGTPMAPGLSSFLPKTRRQAETE